MFRCRVLSLCAAFGLLLLAAPLADASTIIAYWRFEPSNFLADSSGNGNTLVNSAGANAATSSTDVSGPAGGAGSALFDGTDHLSTAANLNLAAYRHLHISWIQRLQSTSTGVKAVFEDSFNYDDAANQGAFLLTVNGDGIPNPSTNGYLALKGASLGRNIDSYPHAVGGTPGTWQAFSADIDLDAATATAVVRIFDSNNVEIGTQTASNAGAPPSFKNDILNIGARANLQIGFVGNIDELKIESVPEPGSFVLLALGSACIGVVAARRRAQLQRG